MDAEAFVVALDRHAGQAALDSLVANLASPPGRRPNRSLAADSDWFGSLAEANKEHVTSIARRAIDSAIFGVLAILDGSRVIENPPHGRFELWYVVDGTRTKLTPETDDFHDIYRRIHPPG